MTDTPSSPSAAPLPDLFASSPAASRGFVVARDHRRIGGRAGFLAFALIFYIVMELLTALHGGAMLRFINQLENGGFASQDAASAYGAFLDMFARPLAIVFLLSLGLCWLSYCLFVYGAVANLHRSHARGVETGPGWAVGYTFVPFVSLWKPFQIMGEILRGSHDPIRGVSGDTPLRPVWWICFVVGNLLSFASARMGLGDGDADIGVYKTTLWIDTVSSALSIIAAACLLVMINGVARARSNWKTIPAG